MSSESLRLYYLQKMGVDVWQLRQKPVTPEIKTLHELESVATACTQCALHQTRHKVVFARGNPNAQLMIIGEAPGFNEDKEGIPFIGHAGKLLNLMLKSVGLNESDVYITNILKCHPPNNRDPNMDEITKCAPYLKKQIAFANPKLILGLGRFAAQCLTEKSLSLAKMRQQAFQYCSHQVVVSYHPAYLLRNPKDKKKSYNDLLYVKKLLDAP